MTLEVIKMKFPYSKLLGYRFKYFQFNSSVSSQSVFHLVYFQYFANIASKFNEYLSYNSKLYILINDLFFCVNGFVTFTLTLLCWLKYHILKKFVKLYLRNFVTAYLKMLNIISSAIFLYFIPII